VRVAPCHPLNPITANSTDPASARSRRTIPRFIRAPPRTRIRHPEGLGRPSRRRLLSRLGAHTRSCARPSSRATLLRPVRAALAAPVDDRDFQSVICARSQRDPVRFVLLLSFMAAGRPITCPLCGSQHLIRLSDEEVPGTTTAVVRYLCDKCHAVFTRQPVKAANQEMASSPASVARRS